MEILYIEKIFQPYLLYGDYTFVGPKNLKVLKKFIEHVMLIAPIKSSKTTVHDALSHKSTVGIVLKEYSHMPLIIYIVSRNRNKRLKVLYRLLMSTARKIIFILFSNIFSLLFINRT